MAELDPEMRPQGEGNFIGYSRGSTPDTSWGGLFQDAGTMISTGVRAGNQIVEQMIRDDVSRSADEIRDVFTDSEYSRMALGRGTSTNTGSTSSASDTPSSVNSYRDRLSSLTSAYRSGNLREIHYWAMLDMESRRIRQRFPGHREEIDRIIQEAVGTTPANALVRELFQAATTQDRAGRDHDHWLRAATTLGTPSAVNYATLSQQGRPPSTAQLQMEVAQIQQGIRTDEATTRALAIRRANGEMVREDGARAAQEALSRRFALMFRTGTQTIPDFERRLNEMLQGGRNPSPQELQQISNMYGAFRARAMQMLDDVMASPGASGQSLETLISHPDTVRDIRRNFEQRLDQMGQAISSGDWGAFRRIHQQVQAYGELDRLQLFGTEAGNAARRTQMFRQIFGDQAFNNQAFLGPSGVNILGSLNAAAREIFDRDYERAIVDGRSLSQLSQEYRQANTTQQRTALLNALIERVIGDISNPQLNEDALRRAATMVFGPDNRNFLENDVTNRAEVYQRLMGDPRVAAGMQRLRNTELYQHYQQWAVNGFNRSISGPAANLHEFILDPRNTTSNLVWNPTTNRFVLQGSNQENIQADVTRINRALQGYTNMLRAEGVSDDEARMIVANALHRTNRNFNQSATNANSAWSRMMESVQNFVGRMSFSNMVYDSRRPDVAGPLSAQGGSSSHYAPLLDLIGRGEGGPHQYNSILGPNRRAIFNEGLTNMTLSEVLNEQRNMRIAQRSQGIRSLDENRRMGRPNAIAISSAAGRYQFLPVEIERISREMGLNPNTTRFNRATQDAMATHILNQRGLGAFLQNPTPENRQRLLDRMADYWAALPGASGQGRINFGGNRANIRLQELNSVLDQLVSTYSRNRPQQ